MPEPCKNTPLFKVLNIRKSIVCNRPILLIRLQTNFACRNISKIFEKLMTSRNRKFTASNGIVSQHQFGFREELARWVPCLSLRTKRSTKRIKLVAVHLDLSKAIDVMNHNVQKIICIVYLKSFHPSTLPMMQRFLCQGTILTVFTEM